MVPIQGLCRRARSVTVRSSCITPGLELPSLGLAMSTFVVQERHLWLNLADMREPNKVWFLKDPVYKAGLFGNAVENSFQRHISRRM